MTDVAAAKVDRASRLEAARRLDWRFLLDDPGLDSMACVEPADPTLLGALNALGAKVSRGTSDELAGLRRQWRVVLVGGRKVRASDVTAAATLVAAGGWLLIELSRGAWARGDLRRVRHALRLSRVDQVRPYWHIPARSTATRLVALDDPSGVRAALERRGSRLRHRFTGWLTPMLAMVPPDLLGGDITLVVRMIGSAEDVASPPAGPLRSAVGTWPPAVGSSAVVLTPRFRASAHVLVLFPGPDGRPRLVAKIARLPEGGATLAKEAKMMEQVRASVARGSVPRVVGLDRIGEHAVLLESGLVGAALDRAAVRRDPRRWIASVRDWLTLLPAADATVSSGVGAALEQIEARLGAIPPNRELVERARTLLRDLEAPAMPRPFEHGDLSHPNLVILDNGQLGVLDWENATPVGMPVHDLCFFLGYVATATAPGGERPFDGLLRVIGNPAWGAASAIRDEGDRLAVPRELLAGLVLACWTRTLARVIATSPPAHLLAGGTLTRERYYALWEGAIRQHQRLGSLLS